MLFIAFALVFFPFWILIKNVKPFIVSPKAALNPILTVGRSCLLRQTELIVFFLRPSRNTATRAKVVEEWSRDGGVLLMGYEMYRLLSLKKSFVVGRKKRSKKAAGLDVLNLDEEDRQQELLKGWRN